MNWKHSRDRANRIAVDKMLRRLGIRRTKPCMPDQFANARFAWDLMHKAGTTARLHADIDEITADIMREKRKITVTKIVSFKMPAKRLPHVSTKCGLKEEALMKAFHESFGVTPMKLCELGRASKYGNITVICRPEQFAEFILLRARYGAENWVAELDAEFVGENFQKPTTVLDVTKDLNVGVAPDEPPMKWPGSGEPHLRAKNETIDAILRKYETKPEETPLSNAEVYRDLHERAVKFANFMGGTAREKQDMIDAFMSGAQKCGVSFKDEPKAADASTGTDLAHTDGFGNKWTMNEHYVYRNGTDINHLSRELLWNEIIRNVRKPAVSNDAAIRNAVLEEVAKDFERRADRVRATYNAGQTHSNGKHPFHQAIQRHVYNAESVRAMKNGVSGKEAARNRTIKDLNDRGKKFQIVFKPVHYLNSRLVTAYFFGDTGEVVKIDGEHTYLWAYDPRLDWETAKVVGGWMRS